MQDKYEKLMRRAFRLAEKGLGNTSPNPPVGAILVNGGEIVGKGYHRRAGLPHAETEALRKAGDRARGATLIVTLEPCSHFGKTPPCADTLIAAGVAQVISATCDPNPIVAGSGYRKLREAGIEVVDGVMKDLAHEFYRAYFKFITTGVPFVTLKFAQSLDGRIATRTGHSQWISSQQSLIYSHRLRAQSDAVLVGSGTLRHDNPKLTTRLVRGRNPIRIVLSESGDFPRDRELLIDHQAPTLVAVPDGVIQTSGDGFQLLLVSRGEAGLDLFDLLKKLGRMSVMNLLVEGGSGVLTSFLRAQLADRIIACVAPIVIGKGTEAIGDLGIEKLDNAIKLEGIELKKSGPDFIISGRPKWS
jgi:diaminohydroxyphosphoribosylaminopyrimidine deaminase/5-amino-6-(5-phosphoribosylamino)uracil reductase